MEQNPSRVSKLIDTLSKKYFIFKAPRINFCNYLSYFIGKRSKKTEAFRESHLMFQREMNLEEFVKKMRMIELYLELNLNSFQKTILKTMCSRVVLSDIE